MSEEVAPLAAAEARNKKAEVERKKADAARESADKHADAARKKVAKAHKTEVEKELEWKELEWIRKHSTDDRSRAARCLVFYQKATRSSKSGPVTEPNCHDLRPSVWPLHTKWTEPTRLTLSYGE